MTLPDHVRIVEVGPRDGFQAESRFIPTELKVEIIERLAAAGVRDIEAVSFVHPRVIPQMADAAEVMARVERRPGVRYLALVPNLKGAERALEAGVDALRLVVCVTETYNRNNVGLSVDESLELFGDVVRLAGDVPTSVVLAVAFGCPFEGEVPEDRVLDLARRFVDLGSAELGIADSAGLANPLQVHRLLRRLAEALPGVPKWLHLHDTRGLGLANAVAAMEEGIDTFDTSLGGLGGCPIMKGASGNIATEEMLYLCHEMGLATGVDLDAVRDASRALEAFLGRELPSRVLRAGTREELVARNQNAGEPCRES
ncbi:MAG: hydroxymethylglutaryl-CoA lyase [bacterium]|nr:hydroxymethylglutaryl-CoA lyase [bacterium]